MKSSMKALTLLALIFSLPAITVAAETENLTVSIKRLTMETALRRWFGWWRDKKDTWTGPIVPDDEGSEDG